MNDENFFEKVYAIAREIPPGRVTTYGAIAEALGTKGSARMVGYAMNGSATVTPPVPAHRVVNRTGLLTGKRAFQGESLMAELLRNEGVEVINDQVVNFRHLFWNPLK
ncbi:methylated-DNA-protein-cysteine methyltransferase-like protein [Arcticibacter pallidicorallinus]|uniref:Methylated-DNA-protein-cysteine methyltransferase-like protein n=1 Tax=Arcticibacter pallidicorallinus TaxID=1259464 RepID=A0A2T0U7P7_9SPHI|nr:MGMT family protein [Arcticibacter pallidicorallinus]PRY53946.1 methylated-DNA-protein-cysteine methyltransferase-like protein [Arcticibacter pallidicorallinus]